MKEYPLCDFYLSLILPFLLVCGYNNSDMAIQKLSPAQSMIVENNKSGKTMADAVPALWSNFWKTKSSQSWLKMCRKEAELWAPSGWLRTPGSPLRGPGRLTFHYKSGLGEESLEINGLFSHSEVESCSNSRRSVSSGEVCKMFLVPPRKQSLR